MFKFICGFIVGYLVFGYAQCELEKKYVKEGIAKLDGKFYSIARLYNQWSEIKK